MDKTGGTDKLARELKQFEWWDEGAEVYYVEWDALAHHVRKMVLEAEIKGLEYGGSGVGNKIAALRKELESLTI